jgi:Zn-dependent protease with chaperone function
MSTTHQFKIHPRELTYFLIMATASVVIYASVLFLLFRFPVISVWFLYIYLFQFLSQAYLIGYIRGNAIKLTESQFSDIHEIVKTQSQQLGLAHVPTVYLLQGNGVLNAFATRFSRRNFVVLHSDILEAAYNEGSSAVKFVIGHELGHIKRNHLGFAKSLLILPARLIPFLGFAYSRACEYTCDMIGYSLCPEGAEKGILILAAGKELYKKINTPHAVKEAASDKGFATWFAEIFSSHPHLIKRVELLYELRKHDESSLSFSSSRLAKSGTIEKLEDDESEIFPPAS